MNAIVASVVEQLRRHEAELAEAVVETHWSRNPELASRYGPGGRQHCLQDACYHLRYLAEAVEAGSAVLFADYVDWARTLLEQRQVPASDLRQNLDALQDTLSDRLSGEQFAVTAPALGEGASRLDQTKTGAGSLLESSRLPELARQYLDALLHADRSGAMRRILDAVEAGTSIRDIYLHVFQPVQYEIGRLWQLNQLTVAEEHYCTAVTQLVMSQLYPRILSSEKNGRVLVCACIGGDLHEIGSRMIADLFELEGWDTHFLGANTPPTEIVRMAADRRADLLALSATMTYHLPRLRETIEAARASSAARILVGGRPFKLDPGLWENVGADGWAADAEQAVAVAGQFFNGEGQS